MLNSFNYTYKRWFNCGEWWLCLARWEVSGPDHGWWLRLLRSLVPRLPTLHIFVISPCKMYGAEKISSVCSFGVYRLWPTEWITSKRIQFEQFPKDLNLSQNCWPGLYLKKLPVSHLIWLPYNIIKSSLSFPSIKFSFIVTYPGNFKSGRAL
jgi:hypothetical protein